jgi:hypothetical protein
MLTNILSVNGAEMGNSLAIWSYTEITEHKLNFPDRCYSAIPILYKVESVEYKGNLSSSTRSISTYAEASRTCDSL